MNKITNIFKKQDEHYIFSIWDTTGVFVYKGRNWVVHEMYQNLTNLSWECQMFTINNKKREIGRVKSKNCKTPLDAIHECLKEIMHEGEVDWIDNDDDDSNDVLEYEKNSSFK